MQLYHKYEKNVSTTLNLSSLFMSESTQQRSEGNLMFEPDACGHALSHKSTERNWKASFDGYVNA